MRERRSRGARLGSTPRASFAAVIAAGIALRGCTDDPGAPQPRLVELRVTGATRFYVSGTASFDSTTVQLRNGIIDLRGVFEARESRSETVVLDLHKQDPVMAGDQTTLRFDRYMAPVLLTPGIVRIDLGLLADPIAIAELRRPEVSAALVDDPCVLDIRFETALRSVDTDRALYHGSFTDLIAITFAGSSSYDGGNLFDDGEDRSAFRSACAEDGWDLADTRSCLDTSGELVCLFYSWDHRGCAPHGLSGAVCRLHLSAASTQELPRQ